MSARAAAVSVLSCLVLACSGGDDDGADDDGTSSSAGASGAAAGDDGGDGNAGSSGATGAAGVSGAGGSSEVHELEGTFLLELVPAVPATADRAAKPAFTQLNGQVLDGETPDGTRWTMTAAEGDCELFEPKVPFCDPICANGDVCVDDDVCAGYPRGLDLGAVTLRGLRTEDGSQSVVSKPVPPKFSYQLPGSPRLQYPPFEAGEAVTLDTAGGELPAFSIRAGGFAPLVLASEQDVPFAPEVATELRWEAPAQAGTRVRVTVDISHHGGDKGEIRCETDDDGSMDIPAALGAGLIALGVAGNPTLQVTRMSAAAAELPQGSVELRLESSVTLGLRIPGVISCDMPGEQDLCPEGQLCQPQHVCR